MVSLQQKLTQSATSPAASDKLFDDERLNELYFRLTARNWPERLSEAENDTWREFCQQRVHRGCEGFRSFDQYKKIIAELKQQAKNTEESEMATMLEKYGEQIANFSKY